MNNKNLLIMLYQNEKNFFLQYRETLLTALVILACLLLSVLYPAAGIGQQITVGLIFSFVLPVLYIKLILKKSLRDFGFSLESPRVGLLWAGSLLALSLAIALLLFHFSGLKGAYALPKLATTNFAFFLLYELALVNLLFFLQEFFFKGFVLFTFFPKFGSWAPVFSSLLYLLLLAVTANLNWQATPFIILSLTGSLVAYKSRSFLYSYLMGLIFLLFFDAYLIYIWK